MKALSLAILTIIASQNVFAGGAGDLLCDARIVRKEKTIEQKAQVIPAEGVDTIVMDSQEVSVELENVHGQLFGTAFKGTKIIATLGAAVPAVGFSVTGFSVILDNNDEFMIGCSPQTSAPTKKSL